MWFYKYHEVFTAISRIASIILLVIRPIRLAQCCTQFKSLLVRFFVYFIWKCVEQNVPFPKDFNSLQHRVSLIGLLANDLTVESEGNQWRMLIILVWRLYLLTASTNFVSQTCSLCSCNDLQSAWTLVANSYIYKVFLRSVFQ